MAKRKKLSKVRDNARHLVTKMNAGSPISEQYRTIRTNLQFASVDQPLRSLLVTSPNLAEGKSTTSANIAIVFAQSGKKVLLIDGDMRNPSLHFTFHLKKNVGFSSVLINECKLEKAVTASDEVPNLDFLSCGPIPPNPSELLGSKAMERMLAEAATRYDLVIFDTPPVLAVTDAQIIADICDGAVLVAKSQQTEYDSIKKAVNLLKPAKAKLLGAVLNGQKEMRENYYYGVN